MHKRVDALEPTQKPFSIEQETDLTVKNSQGVILAKLDTLLPNILETHMANWIHVAGAYGKECKYWNLSPVIPSPNEAREIRQPKIHRNFDESIDAMTFSREGVYFAVATMRKLYILHLGGTDIIIAADDNLDQPIQDMHFTPMNNLVTIDAEKTRMLSIQRR